MAIVGQNTLLNQYVPTFFIKDLRDGQIVKFDSVRKAFVNVDDTSGSGGAERLGQLLDVSDSVDNPLTLQNGQALIYNTLTDLWENKFTDYNTLLNKPTSSSFSFAGLSDTAKPSLPDGYVKWNSAGTQLVYSTTIPASSITGLATVATTGNYNDLTNKPTITNGTVTTVSVVTANGISGIVANPTTTPAITLTLGDITPTSVAASGTVTGSNLSGINTGDQTIALTGDVTGSGTGTFPATLATVNSTTGVFGSDILVPQITVDGKGRIINVVNIPITGEQTITLTGDVTGSGTGTFPTTLATVNLTTGTFGDGITVPQITVDGKGRIINVVNVPIAGSGVGTVTSVTANGTQGVTTFVTNSTTTPDITIGLGDITPTSVAATGTVTGTNLSGTNTGDQTITLTGDATGSGTGTFPLTLATVNADVGVYGDAHFVPTITLNEKGLVTALSTQHVDTSVRDFVPDAETITVDARHQYIVTSVLEVDGYMINNGVIAIL